MKRLLFFLLLTSGSFLTSYQLQAQNWVNGGNALAANGSLGLNTNFALIFKTNNTERGRITNTGNWGIGDVGTDARLTVNSAAGQRSFRARVNGATKFVVQGNGGVSIGSLTAGPADGLYVVGSVGIGTSTPSYKLHVVGNGQFSTGLYIANGGTTSYNSSGAGVFGSGSSYGLYGTSPSIGVYAISTSSGYGVYGQSAYLGVYGVATASSGTNYGVYALSQSSGGYGLYAASNFTGTYSSGPSYGVYGVAGSGGYGVFGGGYVGLYGSGSSWGVFGTTSSGTGVDGRSTNGLAGYFYSTNYYGLRAGTGLSSKNWAGVFDGNVYAFGNYQTSDKRLKKDIEEFEGAISIINKLKPKSYQFQSEERLAKLHLPQGKHYGLIAQDLEEVLPNLVSEITHEVSAPALPKANAEPKAADMSTLAAGPLRDIPLSKKEVPSEATETISIKAVNYIELIPIMIKAMQELSQKTNEIDELRKEVAELRSVVNRLTKGGSSNAALSSAALGLVSPNPVKGAASIQYSIPEGSNRAEMLITDNLGRTIRRFTLTSSGVVHLDATTLSSGVYNYSLVVDNKTIETKKMTVIR